MKKIYIALGIGLIVLLGLVIIIGLLGKSKITSKSATIPTPTLIKIQNNNSIRVANNIQDIPPVETDDFSLSYSPSLNKVVVREKTNAAEQSYYDWAYRNNYPQLVEDKSLTSFFKSTGRGASEKESGSEVFMDFLNIFLNFGQGSQRLNNETIQQSNQSSTVQSPDSSPLPSSSFMYYHQCGDFGSISLPGGCDLCRAGCGPTSVAMITASYIDKNINPQTVVDFYKNHGYTLGCGGSAYSDAKAAIENYGLKTTSYMFYNLQKADRVVNDFKNYIDSGWTLFVLANFRQDGGGHFFWVTDIDSQGNILAYDPYYGSMQIPYNENNRYPYPLYRLAFGVKK